MAARTYDVYTVIFKSGNKWHDLSFHGIFYSDAIEAAQEIADEHTVAIRTDTYTHSRKAGNTPIKTKFKRLEK